MFSNAHNGETQNIRPTHASKMPLRIFSPYINNPTLPLKYLILPEAFEPFRRKLGVTHRMLDVLVSEVVLQGARVVPVIGELETTGVAQHVRVDREGHLGL